MAQLQEQLDNSKKELNQEKIESNNFKEKVTSTLRATKQNTIQLNSELTTLKQERDNLLGQVNTQSNRTEGCKNCEKSDKLRQEAKKEIHFRCWSKLSASYVVKCSSSRPPEGVLGTTPHTR